MSLQEITEHLEISDNSDSADEEEESSGSENYESSTDTRQRAKVKTLPPYKHHKLDQ